MDAGTSKVHLASPFRSDHVGCLRRPGCLEAPERIRGPHDLDHNVEPQKGPELQALEDDAIREVLLSPDGINGTYRRVTDELRNDAGYTMPNPRIDIAYRMRRHHSVNVDPFLLLESQTPQLDSAGELNRRIEEADASTSSVSCSAHNADSPATISAIPSTIEDEKRKLALVVDVARAVWGTA
jgi:hypothetical protein